MKKVKEAEALLREYCKTFEFKPTTKDADTFVGVVGPIVKNAAAENVITVGNSEIAVIPPSIYVNMRGDIVSEHCSKITVIDPRVIREAIGRELLKKMLP